MRSAPSAKCWAQCSFFASLVYLATQIRHSRNAIVSQNIHAETDHFHRVLEVQTDPLVQEPLRKVLDEEEFSYTEMLAFERYMLVSLVAMADVFRHKQLGLATGTSWRVHRRRLSALFFTKQARAWWERSGRYAFERDFTEEVDAMIAQIPEGAEDPVIRAIVKRDA